MSNDEKHEQEEVIDPLCAFSVSLRGEQKWPPRLHNVDKSEKEDSEDES